MLSGIYLNLLGRHEYVVYACVVRRLPEPIIEKMPRVCPWRLRCQAFTYQSFLATGDLYDAFYLDKSETDQKQLTNGE
ncbi:MAG: hypothetical protein AAF004_15600, partial [Pseudomonadota bacterium]